MSTELHNHLFRLLREASDILRQYEREVNREWKRIGEALGKRNARVQEVFSTLCAFVQARLLPYGANTQRIGISNALRRFIRRWSYFP
ncbi:hypothetical protein [Geobacillus sp. JS12]|uniref:hypothetical protein n=1 Tax=Geobacillus sp. JS12 TaxID=1813182 RepID=UPI000A566183|nr:hypothetical protein [Geobacillus sp. JS12]